MPEDEATELPAAGGQDGQDENGPIASPAEEHTVMFPVERAYLLCIGGPLTGQRFPIRIDTTRIGRSKAYNDVVLAGDLRASKRHATIVARGARYFVVDKRSRNRTYVNRHKIGEDEEFGLNFGDEMEVGSAIFRFVRENQWDWRPPVKAGSFWARHGRLVLLVASLVITVLAARVALSALRYLSLARARPSALQLKLRKTAAVGRENRYVASTFSYAPAAIWLSERGCCGVVCAGRDGSLLVLDGRSLTTFTRWPDAAVDTAQAIAVVDVDNDGSDDVVVNTADGGVAAINPRNGLSLWKSGPLGPDLMCPVAADIDGDGLPEVFVAGSGGSLFRHSGSSADGRFEPLGNYSGSLSAAPVLTDLDGDGETEIVLVNIAGRTTVVDAATGGVEVDTAYPADAIKLAVGYTGMPQVYAPPTVAPVPGKTQRMMVIADFNDALCFATAGSPTAFVWAQWLYRKLSERYGLSVKVIQKQPAPVLSDLNRDGHPDALVATALGPLVALDGRNGKPLWEYYDSTRWDAIHASPALFDFDKDGIEDIVFADGRGGVHVIAGKSGKVLAETDTDSVPVYSSPLILDADADGTVDIVVQDAAGRISILASNCPTPERTTFWPMEGGIATGEHVVRFRGFDLGAQWTTLVLAGGVILLLVILNAALFLSHARRRRRLQQVSAH